MIETKERVVDRAARFDSPRSRRRRRRWPWAVAAMVALTALGLAAASEVRSAQASLYRARDLMEQGRAAVLAGQFDVAGRSFRDARDALAEADSELGAPAFRLAGVLPVVGRNVDAVRAMARAGDLVARAGLAATNGLQHMGGLGSLAPRDGEIPIAPLRKLEPLLGESQTLLDRAAGELADAPRSLVVPQIAGARSSLDEQLAKTRSDVGTARALAAALPGFLGADGPRTYFVGAQDPAELRGTGGLIGAYTLMTVDRGRIDLGHFSPIQELRNLPTDAVPAPNPDYAHRYNRYGGAGFWRNINMTPDFPSAAIAIERLYHRVGHERLDGSIVVDPQAVAELLRVTGPVTVPDTDYTIDADNAVSFLSNRAFTLFPDAWVRKRLIGDATATVLQRFLEQSAPDHPQDAVRSLATLAAGGDLLLHARDESVQQAFDAAGASGRLLDPEGDFLSIVGNNAAGNKVDFYVQRTVRYDVRLGPDGSATAEASVVVDNAAPDHGEPAYVLGHYAFARHGTDLTLFTAFCPSSCTLDGAEIDGSSTEATSERELGHRAYTQTIRVRSGASKTFAYRWTVGGAWAPEGDSGTYRLTFQDQPAIHPTRLEVRIHVPAGMRISSAPGMHVIGDDVTWWGNAPRVLRLRLRFARPGSPGGWLWVTGVSLLLGLVVFLFAVRRKHGRRLKAKGPVAD